jgi:GAF domain-containing protein
VPTTSDPPVALGAETLYAVIGAVAQGPRLDRVLPAIVTLLTEATACHACFIYLREGDQLRMRAASTVFAHAVDRTVLRLDEGLCGWVATRRTPAFIRENASADPRTKLVPELQEERFQSMIAVPLLDRDGEAIGVVALHTEAPREFGREVVDFLVHVASLVAGAVDSARLVEAGRLQVARLSALATLSQDLAAVAGRARLEETAVAGLRALLPCDRCWIAPGDERELARTSPRAVRRALTVGDELLGTIVVEGPPLGGEDHQILDAVANQLAVALKKAELIARLTEENLVREVFDDLAAGGSAGAAERARAAGYDLGRACVVAFLEPLLGDGESWAQTVELIELHLRRVVPGALCDPGPDRLRALLPLDAQHDTSRIDAVLSRLAAEHALAVGRSEPRAGLEDAARSLAEAADTVRLVHALLPDGGARGWSQLGVYRYLAQLPADAAPDERHQAAVARLAAYDARRRTELTRTLEQYLGDRGAMLTTARNLFIHANTLRQRLERIEQVTGLALADEDLLGLELALKLAHLRG